MGTKVKTLVGSVAVCVLFVSTAAAQIQTPDGSSALYQALYRSVCERVQAPLVFSTRDTVFALSLPQDEPAEVYVQLTVGKNGKVKEKLTKVHANHIAGYVAPAFLAATKDLKIDKTLLGDLTGKDTSLILTFPLEYQCVYDTINKEWPDTHPYMIPIRSRGENSATYEGYLWENSPFNDDRIRGDYHDLYYQYVHSEPTRIWYYLAFIKE